MLEKLSDGQYPPNLTAHQLTVRLLIPLTASGTVLGRGGSNIRQIAEESMCKLQLGENVDKLGTGERMVTLTCATNSVPSLVKVAIFC